MLWVVPPVSRRLLSIFLFATSLFMAPVSAEQQTPAALIKALQQGGLVVYLRHTATHKDQIDQRPIDLNDCSKQRNLSEQGKQDARHIGAAFTALDIPVSAVISSPFCRCKETAQLAFQDFSTNDNLFFSIGLPKQEREAKTAVLRQLLALPVPSGNRIIISHTSNLKEAAGIWPKTEGSAYLFKPQGDEQFAFLGEILPSDWGRLK